MIKETGLILALLLLGYSVLAGPSLLPDPYREPQFPQPGTSGCASCGFGEKPVIDRFCYALARIDLLEEKDLPANELLTVNIGAPGPFSPENRYVIHPPNTPGSVGNYLMAEVGAWKILFKTEMDKIGGAGFFAVNLPGYILRCQHPLSMHPGMPDR